MKQALSIFAIALLLFACRTVESISVSQIPEVEQRLNVVKVEESSPIILFIPFGSSFVDEARRKLLAACENGAIEGVMSKFEVRNYFLSLVMTQNVLMQGYCIKTTKSRSKKS